MSGEADIEKMVLKPTWKEMLLDMIVSEKLNPWNIDITVLSNGFISKIKKMKTLELHVPANVILAAAILLRYKSDAIRIVEEPPLAQAACEEAPGAEEIPSLELVSRIPPKGPITIEDLMNEMEKVMKYDQPAAPKPKTAEETLTIPVPTFDIEERMDSVFSRVKSKVDSEGWTTFSMLLENKENEHVIETLLPLLHLSQKRMVDLRQDEFFGEIFIRMN